MFAYATYYFDIKSQAVQRSNNILCKQLDTQEATPPRNKIDQHVTTNFQNEPGQRQTMGEPEEQPADQWNDCKKFLEIF